MEEQIHRDNSEKYRAHKTVRRPITIETAETWPALLKYGGNGNCRDEDIKEKNGKYSRKSNTKKQKNTILTNR